MPPPLVNNEQSTLTYLFFADVVTYGWCTHIHPRQMPCVKGDVNSIKITEENMLRLCLRVLRGGEGKT